MGETLSMMKPEIETKYLGSMVGSALGDAMGQLAFRNLFLSSSANSFEDCLRCAIMHGGDRDTLGAMAGAGVGEKSEKGYQRWKRDCSSRLYCLKRKCSAIFTLCRFAQRSSP